MKQEKNFNEKIVVELSPSVVSNIANAQNSTSKSSGYLLGLFNASSKCLEITNSFPLVPQWNESGVSKQNLEIRVKEMLSYFRTMNVDYDIVGFYTLTSKKDFLTEKFIGSLFDYQKCNPNFVGLVFDSSCISNLSASFRAFKLKSSLLDYFNKVEAFEVSDLEFGTSSISNSDILDEICIRIKSSPFTNICCNMLQKGVKQEPRSEISSKLSDQVKPLKSLGLLIDEINSKVSRQNAKVKQYVQQVNQRENFIDRRNAENHKRLQKGEPILPVNDDLNTIFGPLPVPTRIENVISLISLDRQNQAVKESSTGNSEHLALLNEISQSVQ